MIAIVTDSTCDLPASLRALYPFSVIPVHIHFDSEDFLDGVTIDAQTFYQRIAETGIIPTTSQPSVGEFAQLYRELATNGADEIITMHVTGRLSGTVRTAEMAAREVADEITVHVFDSGGGSAGLGYMAMEASEAAQAGQSTEEILTLLKRIRDNLTITLTPLNLEFLQKSGRVSRLQGVIGTLLNIKPIIELKEGALEATERVRSRRKALDRVVKLTAAAHNDRPLNLAVVHATASDDAHVLLDKAATTLNGNQVFTTDLALSVAVHLGPGTVGLVAYPAEISMLS